MDKKDIYEHLAKIYLDASLKRRKKSNVYSGLFKNLFFISLAFIFGLSIFFFTNFKRNKPLNQAVSLVLCPDVVKINFHFDPAKKEIYSISLNALNLNRFKVLGFSAKTAHYQDNVFLRVEFTNAFKERAEIYIKNIKNRWQDYKINLSEFKNISDWSKMLDLSFIVEEWNVEKKRSIIYLDNVRLLK